MWREPTSVIMHLTSKGRETIPDPADGLAFIGDPGDTYYSIPQTQNPEVLWAGLNTEAFQSADIQGKFDLSLDEVEGPGELLVFGWSPFGEPLMRFETRDGLPDTYKVPARTHEHANWAFTEEGVYRLTFTFGAELASGEKVSDSQVFTMAVGDVDPAEVTLPGEGAETGGTTDGGAADGGSTDGGSTDAGSTDGGGVGGAADGGAADGGSDTGGAQGGSTDGGTEGVRPRVARRVDRRTVARKAARPRVVRPRVALMVVRRTAARMVVRPVAAVPTAARPVAPRRTDSSPRPVRE